MLHLADPVVMRVTHADGSNAVGSLTTRWKDDYYFIFSDESRADYIEDIRVSCDALQLSTEVPRHLYDPPYSFNRTALPEKWETHQRFVVRLRQEPRWNAPSIRIKSSRAEIGFRFSELEARGEWLKVQYYLDPGWPRSATIAVGWILRSAVFEIDPSTRDGEVDHDRWLTRHYGRRPPPPGTVLYEGLARISLGARVYWRDHPFAFVTDDEIGFDVRFVDSSEHVGLMQVPWWYNPNPMRELLWVSRDALLTWPKPKHVVESAPPKPPE